jgi:hypothetical protein
MRRPSGAPGAGAAEVRDGPAGVPPKAQPGHAGKRPSRGRGGAGRRPTGEAGREAQPGRCPGPRGRGGKSPCWGATDLAQPARWEAGAGAQPGQRPAGPAGVARGAEAQPGQAGRRSQLGRAGAGPAGELQRYAGPGGHMPAWVSCTGPGRALIRPGHLYSGPASLFRPDGVIIRPRLLLTCFSIFLHI